MANLMRKAKGDTVFVRVNANSPRTQELTVLSVGRRWLHCTDGFKLDRETGESEGAYAMGYESSAQYAIFTARWVKESEARSLMHSFHLKLQRLTDDELSRLTGLLQQAVVHA